MVTMKILKKLKNRNNYNRKNSTTKTNTVSQLPISSISDLVLAFLPKKVHGKFIPSNLRRTQLLTCKKNTDQNNERETKTNCSGIHRD